MVTFERRDDILEHTTVTGGVVVIAMVAKAWDIMKTLQRKEQVNSMKCSIHPLASSQVKWPKMMGMVWSLSMEGQMAVLTDIEMPDRCTDSPPKRPYDIWSVQKWRIKNLQYAYMHKYRYKPSQSNKNIWWMASNKGKISTDINSCPIWLNWERGIRIPGATLWQGV